MKRLIYVIESKSWVQFQRAKFLSRELKDIDIKIIEVKKFLILWRIGFFRREKIFFSSWRIIHGILKKNNNFFRQNQYKNFSAAVTSHSNIGGGLNPEIATGSREPSEAFLIAIDILSRFRNVSVNSIILWNLLNEKITNLYYCPNGVDENFFYPIEDKKFNAEDITIGWTGKNRAAKNLNLIRDIEDSFSDNKFFTFKIIEVDKKLQFKKDKSEMFHFYNELDFYLNVSWNEGTPNPALEAAAAGVPIITTRVGNMPELIKHRENGFFIEPNLVSLSEQLKALTDITEEQYEKMSRKIRSDILKNWTWKIRIENFKSFLNEVINQK